MESMFVLFCKVWLKPPIHAMEQVHKMFSLILRKEINVDLESILQRSVPQEGISEFQHNHTL